MKTPEIPINELKRFNALQELDIIDTPAQEEYDEITQLASHLCEVPVALVSLVADDKQWFKSKVGLDICETSRDLSFCAHAINHPSEILEVPDARKDPRFFDNDLTLASEKPVIFYAGMPLVDKMGFALGTLCVIDHKPKKLSEIQRKGLKALANQVVKLLELRKANNELIATDKKLKEQNDLLKDFAGVVSHDMKMPLANMIITTDLIRKKYDGILDDKGETHMVNLKKSAIKLSNYITGILSHYESEKLSNTDIEDFYIHDLLEDIIDMLNITENCEINLPDQNIPIKGNWAALKQILLNLINNSIKYNDKTTIQIDIDCDHDEAFYHFTVADNGIGIPEDQVDTIFDLFKTLVQQDRQGNQGNGIGLSTVKKIVDSMNGKISVLSKLGEGTTFKFSIEKAA